MVIDATFWVGVSFILFFAGLIYLKVPQKINEILNNLITNIKNEIAESENLIIEMNDKFHKSSEIKKNLAENKISQMKEAALKEIKDNSIRLAIDSVKKLISTSIDKSKLDNLFEKNLEESKVALKKINS